MHGCQQLFLAAVIAVVLTARYVSGHPTPPILEDCIITASHCEHGVGSKDNAICPTAAAASSSPFEVQAVKDVFTVLGAISAVIGIIIFSRQGVTIIRTWWRHRDRPQLPSFVFVTPWRRRQSWEQEPTELPTYFNSSTGSRIQTRPYTHFSSFSDAPGNWES